MFQIGLNLALAHAVVDGLFDAGRKTLEAHVHPDLEKDVDDAGVLADRAAAFGAHLRVGEDLRDRVFRGRALLGGVGARKVRDVVGGVVVADVLKSTGDALDEIAVGHDGAGGGGHGEAR